MPSPSTATGCRRGWRSSSGEGARMAVQHPAAPPPDPAAEDALIPLSALQHYLFCPRQCAVIHVEQLWAEDAATAEGRLLHEKADGGRGEKRPGVRIARARPALLRARGLGQGGLVEFLGTGTGAKKGRGAPAAPFRWNTSAASPRPIGRTRCSCAPKVYTRLVSIRAPVRERPRLIALWRPMQNLHGSANPPWWRQRRGGASRRRSERSRSCNALQRCANRLEWSCELEVR